MINSGKFIISLDCEMLWGMRDHADKSSVYGSSVLAGHDNMKNLLYLFEKYDIHATWAFVGMCLLENKDEIIKHSAERRPSYQNRRLNNYSYIEKDYEEEGTDNYYYSGDMAGFVAQFPNQEIATHTFSHYYCLEKGQKKEEFEEDLKCSLLTMEEKLNEYPVSIIFPRNQVNSDYLSILENYGICRYRGKQKYRSTNKNVFGKVNRALFRYFTIPAFSCTYKIEKQIRDRKLLNIPSTSFFEIYNGKNERMAKRYITVFKNVMTLAARTGRTVHLCFHPHNLGQYTSINMERLEELLGHYSYLNKKYGFKSCSMREI